MPVPGEALDSWLDAIAARHRVSRSEILGRCSLTSHARCGAWMRRLAPCEVASVARVTAVDPEIIDALALPRFGQGSGPLRGARLLGSSAWGWRGRSRWCPQCLSETGGRWALAWRLNWSFACRRHSCLLEDFCPKCSAHQRERVPASAVPELGKCEKARGGSRCGADLSDRAPQPLSPRTLQTQSLISALLAGEHRPLALYCDNQPPSQRVLADLQLLTRFAFALQPAIGRDDVFPSELPDSHRDNPSRNFKLTNPCAVGVAAAATAAVGILNIGDTSTAHRTLTSLIRAGTRPWDLRGRAEDSFSGPLQLVWRSALSDARSAYRLQRRLELGAARATHRRADRDALSVTRDVSR